MAPESPSPSASGGFNVNSINRNDLSVMIAGIVVFIASFLPYWGYSFGPFSASINAWHSYAVVGLLLVFAAAIVIAVKTFASLPSLPVGIHVLAGVLAGLGTLLLIIRAFTYPHHSLGGGYSYGVKWGAYVLFIAAIAETVFAVLGMRESGERVSWQQPGSGTSTPPPAAPPTA